MWRRTEGVCAFLAFPPVRFGLRQGISGKAWDGDQLHSPRASSPLRGEDRGEGPGLAATFHFRRAGFVGKNAARASPHPNPLPGGEWEPWRWALDSRLTCARETSRLATGSLRSVLPLPSGERTEVRGRGSRQRSTFGGQASSGRTRHVRPLTPTSPRRGEGAMAVGGGFTLAHVAREAKQACNRLHSPLLSLPPGREPK